MCQALFTMYYILNFHNNVKRQVQLIPPLSDEKMKAERLHNVPKVPHLDKQQLGFSPIQSASESSTDLTLYPSASNLNSETYRRPRASEANRRDAAAGSEEMPRSWGDQQCVQEVCMPGQALQ